MKSVLLVAGIALAVLVAVEVLERLAFDAAFKFDFPVVDYEVAPVLLALAVLFFVL